MFYENRTPSSVPHYKEEPPPATVFVPQTPSQRIQLAGTPVHELIGDTNCSAFGTKVEPTSGQHSPMKPRSVNDVWWVPSRLVGRFSGLQHKKPLGQKHASYKVCSLLRSLFSFSHEPRGFACWSLWRRKDGENLANGVGLSGRPLPHSYAERCQKVRTPVCELAAFFFSPPPPPYGS